MDQNFRNGFEKVAMKEQIDPLDEGATIGAGALLGGLAALIPGLPMMFSNNPATQSLGHAALLAGPAIGAAIASTEAHPDAGLAETTSTGLGALGGLMLKNKLLRGIRNRNLGLAIVADVASAGAGGIAGNRLYKAITE